jgi:hypothetical protein
MNGFNPLTLILILNSIIIISLVLTQNENTKDLTSQNNSRNNPIETIIWGCVFFEILMLLISGKITDF